MGDEEVAGDQEVAGVLVFGSDATLPVALFVVSKFPSCMSE